MKKYQIIRCICWKGESVGASINNPRNQEDAGTFPTNEKAKVYMIGLRQREASRIEQEKETEQGWNGNEFVFWIDEVESDTEL